MSLNRILQIIFAFGTLSILAVAGIYGYQQQILLRQMKIALDGAEFDNISLRNISMRLRLKFNNQSAISIAVKEYNFDVLLNNQPAIKIQSPGPGFIAAHTESVNQLRVQFDPIAVLGKVFKSEQILALLFDYSKLLITITGTISVEHAGIGIKKIPITQTSSVAELMNDAQ